MKKEIRNVFFGKLLTVQTETVKNEWHMYPVFNYSLELIDEGTTIEITKDNVTRFHVDIGVALGDQVQVTQWSDGTVTIERFNEN